MLMIFKRLKNLSMFRISSSIFDEIVKSQREERETKSHDFELTFSFWTISYTF